jgi:hypothetical protein
MCTLQAAQSHSSSVLPPLTRKLEERQLSAGKGKKKKKKRKQQEEEGNGSDSDSQADQLRVQLLQSAASQQPVPAETPNSQAWRPPAALVVGACVLPIEFNPPTVEALEMPPRPAATFPVLPVLELMYADESACEWEWFRLAEGAPVPASRAAAAARPPGEGTALERLECTDSVYTPTDADIGRRLLARCTPVATQGGVTRRGEPVDATSGVRSAPCMPHMHARRAPRVPLLQPTSARDMQM